MKKVKTDAEKKKDFHKYWIKPAHYMKEEEDLYEELWDDDPYSIFEDFGIQKAVPMTIK